MNPSARQGQIQQQIAEAEKRRTLAQLAEQQRIADEQANQRIIEESQQELAALHQQQTQARIEDAVRINNQFIAEQCDPAVNRFIATLDGFEAGKAPFTAVREAARQVDATFKQQRGIASTGASAAFTQSNAHYVPDPRLSVGGNAYMSGHAGSMALERFASALDVRLALALYISRGDTPEAKDYRRGIAFFFVRYVMNEGENTTMNSLKEQARREWLAQMTGR